MQYTTAQMSALIEPMTEAYATELGEIRLTDYPDDCQTLDPRNLVSVNDYNIGADRCMIFAKNAFREGLFGNWSPNQWETAGVILCRRDSGSRDDEFRDNAEKWGFSDTDAAAADSFMNRFLSRCPLQEGSREILFARNESFEPMPMEGDPKEGVCETLSPANPENFLAVLKDMRSRKAVSPEMYEKLAFELRNGYSWSQGAYVRNEDAAARAQGEIREMFGVSAPKTESRNKPAEPHPW